ncbi:MAG: hypothetical protein COA79_13575 [Planctomycetota bacterium]|nr:MAG: hypothetical protein COA79_13575 [Planctomycetota bacterium]
MNKLFLVIFIINLLISISLLSDEKINKDELKSSLVIQQENIKKLILSLDEKLVRLANKLKEKEPENAALLLLAYKKSKESLISLQVDQNIDLLKNDELQESITAQKKILDNLFKVMSALTDEDISVKEEIKRLEKLKKKINRLIKEEKKLIRESSKIENKEKATKDLSEEIEKLEDVIKKSEKILDKTVKNRLKGIQSLTDIAKGLENIQNKVSKIHSKIEGSPISSKKEKKEELFKEDKKTKKEDKTSEPGASELKSAFKSLKKAESEIINGRPFSSEGDQKKAIASLKKALSKLKKEKDRIVALPKDYPDELAEKQDKSLEDLKKISGDDKNNKLPEENKNEDSSENDKGEQSKGESKKKDDQSGKKGENSGEKGASSGESDNNSDKKPEEKKPQSPMEKTQKFMQEASKNLRKKNIAKAKEEQKKALKELEKIKEEIDKTLAQLRDEEKEEKLAKLESRFIEILNRQKILLSNTVKLNKLKKASGWTRLEKIKVQELSLEEIDIKELVVKTEDLLLEDASTVVFPDVVNLLKEDMIEIAGFLKEGNVDELTIILEKETIKTLDELIEALQKAQKDLEKDKESKEGQPNNGNSGNTQLVSKSSELKLLQKMQLRVNRMTEFFNKNEISDASRKKKEVKRIFKKQKHVLNITIKMNERR